MTINIYNISENIYETLDSTYLYNLCSFCFFLTITYIHPFKTEKIFVPSTENNISITQLIDENKIL